MAVVLQKGEGFKRRKEVSLFWHDTVVQFVKFVVGRIKNFFSKETVVILTNVRMNVEVIPLDNMVNGEVNFQIMEISSEKSRKLSECMAFWKDSSENILKKLTECEELLVKTF
jgi:hypothetical protein